MTTLTPLSLLYVEDDPIIRDLLSQLVTMKFPDLKLITAGGRIWAEGEIDKGAVFYFALPQTD